VGILKKFGPWIVSIALCLLAVEVLGAAIFYRNTKSLIYFNKPKAVPEPVSEVSYKRHLHPYFGYTGPYSTRGPTVTPTNNLGFIDIQQREVPFKPEANDFVVFIFGSSVASRLMNNSTHARPSLQEALQNLPQLAGKNVVLYNMAQGPGKQPQQLMELAFLIASGQHIDLVLDLGGTLEFVSGMNNYQQGIDPIFPPVEILLAIGNELTPPDTSSSDYYELAYGVAHARAESKRYAVLLDGSASGIAYLKNRIFRSIYERSLARNLTAYDQNVSKQAGWEAVRQRLGVNMPIKTSKEGIVEYIFDIWVRCSDLMKVMASSSGAAYLNVVLPNPYHSKKLLTESEKAVLNAPESNYIRQGSSVGHGMIESRAEMLKSHGIALATAIFDDIPDTIYLDGSGHMNKLGETIMTEFVADQVRLRLGPAQGK
jgi:hypothetical protein